MQAPSIVPTAACSVVGNSDFGDGCCVYVCRCSAVNMLSELAAAAMGVAFPAAAGICGAWPAVSPLVTLSIKKDKSPKHSGRGSLPLCRVYSASQWFAVSQLGS